MVEKIGAVVDYGTHSLRVPLHPDLKRFDLIYKKPKMASPGMGCGSIPTHRAALANLSNMVCLLKVVNAFDKESPHLGYANQLVATLQNCSKDNIPVHIGIEKPAHNTGVGSGANPPLQRAPGPEKLRAHQDSVGTKTGDEESAVDGVSAASTRLTFDSRLGGELCSHAHGQAVMGATPESDEFEDLFASSPEGDMEGPSL